MKPKMIMMDAYCEGLEISHESIFAFAVLLTTERVEHLLHCMDVARSFLQEQPDVKSIVYSRGFDVLMVQVEKSEQLSLFRPLKLMLPALVENEKEVLLISEGKQPGIKLLEVADLVMWVSPDCVSFEGLSFSSPGCFKSGTLTRETLQEFINKK